MKNFLRNLIIVLLVCSALVYLALHIDFDEESNKTDDHSEISYEINEELPVDDNYFSVPFNLADYLYKDIYINGKHINNWNLVYPFTVIDGQFFLPMTENVLNSLGLDFEFDDLRHAIVLKPNYSPSMSSINEGKLACNLQYLEVYWGHKYHLNGELMIETIAATSKDTDANGNRILYVSIDALKNLKDYYLSYYYDEISGLYISTIEGIDAATTYIESNAKYIEGHARFMMDRQKLVDWDTALYYEYLFRHEADMYDCLEQDLLMGVCMTESRFNTDAQSRANAIGLLQILYKYAEQSGYSEEMLKDPHYNLEYAASSLALGYDRVDGNKVKWLTAYNMGYYALMNRIQNGQSYSTEYADRCIYYENMLKSYLIDNNYSDTFL